MVYELPDIEGLEDADLDDKPVNATATTEGAAEGAGVETTGAGVETAQTAGAGVETARAHGEGAHEVAEPAPVGQTEAAEGARAEAEGSGAGEQIPLGSSILRAPVADVEAILSGRQTGLLTGTPLKTRLGVAVKPGFKIFLTEKKDTAARHPNKVLGVATFVATKEVDAAAIANACQGIGADTLSEWRSKIELGKACHVWIVKDVRRFQQPQAFLAKNTQWEVYSAPQPTAAAPAAAPTPRATEPRASVRRIITAATIQIPPESLIGNKPLAPAQLPRRTAPTTLANRKVQAEAARRRAQDAARAAEQGEQGVRDAAAARQVQVARQKSDALAAAKQRLGANATDAEVEQELCKCHCTECDDASNRRRHGLWCSQCKEWWHVSCVEHRARTGGGAARAREAKLARSDRDASWLCPTCHVAKGAPRTGPAAAAPPTAPPLTPTVPPPTVQPTTAPLQPAPDPAPLDSDSDSAYRVAVGSRLRIWWVAEGQWFEGVVDASRTQDDSVINHVTYDDGDKRWYNFADPKVVWEHVV
jgi:hypothetical protein